jgi:hypothetical protein
MSRPRSTGIKPIRKRMADGSVRTYYYDRRTGHALGTDLEAALARTRESLSKTDLTPDTMAALIVDYKVSPQWKKLAPKTQRDYGQYLDLICSLFGDLRVRDLEPKHVAWIQRRYSDRPRQANYFVAVLRILLNLAVKQRLIIANPAENPDMLPTKARTQIWSREDQADFLAASDPRVHLAFLLMLYTTQRLADVLAMTKGQVYASSGRLLIQLRQQKTGTLIAVPVHRDLAPRLRARLESNTDGTLLVPSPLGRSWSTRNFSRMWDDGMRRMALRRARTLFRQGWTKDRVRGELSEQHRQRRDLRRTGIVRMAELGLSTPRIASISGHEIDYCQRIIDTYLPRRTETAIAAMDAWEAAEDMRADPVNVVRLASVAGRKR